MQRGETFKCFQTWVWRTRTEYEMQKLCQITCMNFYGE